LYLQSSYWESSDVIAFVLRQIGRFDSHTRTRHKRREGVRNGHIVSARPSPRKVDQKTNIGQVEKRDGQPPRQRRNRNRFAQDPVYAGDDVPQWMYPTRKVNINLV
jgi:hypothetical protein